MIKKVKKSHFFDFKHYYDEGGVHIFSTELIDGIEKRIDKDLAIRFDELAQEDYFREKNKKSLLVSNKNEILYIVNKIKDNADLNRFKKQFDIELKRITSNVLNINDLTTKQITLYFNFSRNASGKQFNI